MVPRASVDRSQTVLAKRSKMSGSAKTQGEADFLKFQATGEQSTGVYKSRLAFPEAMASGAHFQKTMGTIVVGKRKAMNAWTKPSRATSPRSLARRRLNRCTTTTLPPK